MRRDFGSLLPDLIDQKMTQKNILQVYSAAAEAIDKWEPRFRMLMGAVNAADASGRIQLDLYGTYYPRGHLGDYSVAETRDTTVIFAGQN